MSKGEEKKQKTKIQVREKISNTKGAQTHRLTLTLTDTWVWFSSFHNRERDEVRNLLRELLCINVSRRCAKSQPMASFQSFNAVKLQRDKDDNWCETSERQLKSVSRMEEKR